jgi:hypothetical protein
MWLHWRRKWVVLSVLLATGLTVVLMSGQAYGVMMKPPPKFVATIHHDSARGSSGKAAAQAAAALSALKALFALPAPAMPPELALTPTPPVATGANPPAAAASSSSSAPVAAVPATAPLPPPGHATAYGCAAAMAYLEAYAAPDFIIACAIDPSEHQATTTCISGYSACSLGRFILISDPCPAAYMNEASNSRVLIGLSEAPLDPYGSCG